ncbi:hypothetical protein BGW39_005370 [Mortierella sp. 14UC]|nr:hypothetical protein BGW39_005370 [Mortierella sp. 14UC]
MDSRHFGPALSDVELFGDSRPNSFPQRSIFNVEIIDSQTDTPQVLDGLQRSGPLLFRGFISEDKRLSNSENGKSRHIYGEIIEWTHQYDSAHPKRPIFWLKSEVGWYKIEANVLVQLVVEMRLKDDMRVLIPQVAVLLTEPESMVSRMLQRHRKQLLDLGASDSVIRGTNFYKTWAMEQASKPAGLSLGLGSSNAFDVSGAVDIDTLTDDLEIITDSEADIQNSHLDGIDNNDRRGTSQSRKPLAPIASYDMVDRDVIPNLEADVENYEELPAPCTDDICPVHPERWPLHPVYMTFPRNAISDDMQLLYSKFGPPLQLESGVKLEPGLESYSGLRNESLTVSDPGSFCCPVQGCLITISNTTIATTKDFVASISQHIGTHDLSQGDTESILRDYLAKPWKKPVRPKAWDTTARQLNTQTPTLNLHAYWMLNSKKTLDIKATTQMASTTSGRSRKRATSQAVQTTPSSSSTSSPRSTPSIRQPRTVARNSVEHSLESAELIETAKSTTGSTRIHAVQKTTTISIIDVTSRGSSIPDRARYCHQDREASVASSSTHRGRSKRRAHSNESNVSGDEANRYGRKLRRTSLRLPSEESEGDQDLEMRMRRTPVASRRSVSRGRAATSTNATQSLRRSNRSRSRPRAPASTHENQLFRRNNRSRSRAMATPSANVKETRNLRRGTRSRSRPRAPVSVDAYETLYMERVHDRSRSRSRTRNIEQFRLDMDMDYEDEPPGHISEIDVDDSGSAFYYNSTWERGRSMSSTGAELPTPKNDGYLSKHFSTYRIPKGQPLFEQVFMRCYRCQALTRTSSDHLMCQEPGSEDNPVVLTLDD